MIQKEITHKDPLNFDSDKDYNCICFKDWRICDFLEQWEKMNYLKEGAMIDDQVYEFWRESTLTKLNSKVDRWDDL